jgi:osmotically inducible protein OsmC
MRTLYTAVSTAHGGRDGHVRSSDGIVDLDLKTPKEMGGPGGAGTNPEQLFAAGYAACFESAMRAVARKKKTPLLSVELHGKVEGWSTEDTHALMEAAHQVCPYSNATRGNIEVKLIAE